jgi:hypothetical protein
MRLSQIEPELNLPIDDGVATDLDDVQTPFVAIARMARSIEFCAITAQL